CEYAADDRFLGHGGEHGNIEPGDRYQVHRAILPSAAPWHRTLRAPQKLSGEAGRSAPGFPPQEERMTDSKDGQSAAGLQAMLAAGQAMAQGFFDTLARQHAVMQDSSGAAAPKVPMPEAEALAAMQKAFAEK